MAIFLPKKNNGRSSNWWRRPPKKYGEDRLKRTVPPFRADHVGSLLRPQELHEARRKRAKGEISANDLKAIEDREIERVIKKQEEVGLQAITDGEFRRSWWHLDFL